MGLLYLFTFMVTWQKKQTDQRRRSSPYCGEIIIYIEEINGSEYFPFRIIIKIDSYSYSTTTVTVVTTVINPLNAELTLNLLAPTTVGARINP